MKKYKRLTQREKGSFYIAKECEKCTDAECAWIYNCEHRVNAFCRLAELEDKIENGTLVELPCKVGDNVYHLSDKKICEEVVKQIKYNIYNGEIDLLNSNIMTDDDYSKDYNFYRISKLGKSLFLTKSEAEAKLRELRGGIVYGFRKRKIYYKK